MESFFNFQAFLSKYLFYEIFLIFNKDLKIYFQKKCNYLNQKSNFFSHLITHSKEITQVLTQSLGKSRELKKTPYAGSCLFEFVWNCFVLLEINTWQEVIPSRSCCTSCNFHFLARFPSLRKVLIRFILLSKFFINCFFVLVNSKRNSFIFKSGHCIPCLSFSAVFPPREECLYRGRFVWKYKTVFRNIQVQIIWAAWGDVLPTLANL